MKRKKQTWLDKMHNFLNNNKEIVSEVVGLTQHILERDLKEAKKYKAGYYKNKLGEYMFVKGVEVTNDLGNLCRMGFNGEDRGVWIHYTILDDSMISYIDVPIATFQCQYFNKRLCDKKKIMHPTTKEDFEEAVKRLINNLIGEYEQKRDLDEYIKFFKKFNKINEEIFKQEIKELPLE